MKTVLLWIQTIGWALICLLALAILVPISFVFVGILSRNDAMHIPDPESDELLQYFKDKGYDIND